MPSRGNEWGVSYARILFLERILKAHGNVVGVVRTSDILFHVARSSQSDTLKILCCDEYVFGEVLVCRALDEFSGVNILFVGGNWNGYTTQAKECCCSMSIGLYNASEINGALWKDDFWNYVTKDRDGSPRYYYKSA